MVNNELGRGTMSDTTDENLAVQQVAREMLDRDGADAAHIARERADADGRLGNLESSVRWRFVAMAIEQMQAASETA